MSIIVIDVHNRKQKESETVMKQQSPEGTTVTSCQIVKIYRHFCSQLSPKARFGLRLTFSDESSSCYPDLMIRKSWVKRLGKRLEGHTVDPETLPDIIEDYLGEVYGLSWKKSRGLRHFQTGDVEK